MKTNAFEGTADLTIYQIILVCLSVDKPNSIRLVENTPLFIDDITEDNTTKFIIIAVAEAIPACEKMFTNGLTLGLI